MPNGYARLHIAPEQHGEISVTRYMETKCFV